MKKILLFILIIAILLSTVISAAPGDSNDPIVVLSYLNQRLADLVKDNKIDTADNLNAKILDLEKELKEIKNQSSVQLPLEIVELHGNEKLIAQAGTEIILRGGKAFIIASELGGITNVTMGKDFGSDMAIPSNNYLIVPRSDGRGVYTNDYAIFMVRGQYEIIKE